jgi:DNA-binding CsgD family transcriptional regulator
VPTRQTLRLSWDAGELGAREMAISDDSSPAAGEPGPGSADPMRGRAAEWQAVGDLLRQAQRGLSGVVLVEGDPGAGKTRLLRQATDEAARMGFSLAVAAADRLGQAIPFFALRAALGVPMALPAGEVRDRSLPESPAWWISQARAQLERRADVNPVLACLDDLQWESRQTLAALRTLPGALKRRPVAWILARSTAPQNDADYLFRVLEKEGALPVRLDPLGDHAVSAVLLDWFGAPADHALLSLAGGAAGNPALLSELISGLREDDAVHIVDGRAVLVSEQLPARMLHLGRQRLDGLSQRARRLLETATVLDPSFRLEDAAEMLGEPPTAMLSAVEEAMDAGIMTAGEDALSFQHPLLRRVVSEMIPAPVRSALHRQYGQILLRGGESVGVAARHLLQAAHAADHASLADLDDAAAQAISTAPQAAADLASRALELTSAANPRALERAVAAAESLAAAGRLRAAGQIAGDALARPLAPPAEARLRCVVSTVLCARGQTSDAQAEAAWVLAQPELPASLRDQALTAELQALSGLRDERGRAAADAVIAAPRRQAGHTVAAALVTRAMIARDEGHLADAIELLRDAARRGGGISPDARDAQPLLALAAALIDLRELDEAGNILTAADDQLLLAGPAQAALPILRARIRLAGGHFAAAAAHGEEALAAAAPLGADGHVFTAQCVLAVIALRSGDVAAAAHYIASRDAETHVADRYAWAETTLGEAHVQAARAGPAEAIGHIRRVCADLPARPGLLLGDPAAASWLVRTALAAGDDNAAAAAARTAEALARESAGNQATAAAAAHALGLLRQDLTCLARAAADHPDPWARASAAEDIGVWHARRSDRDGAIQHLTEAIQRYQSIGAPTDMARVRRRLRTLGVRRRHWTRVADRPAAGWQSLTDTERIASEFVAEGLSNQQVADQMYISVNTVACHLRQIFQKLGIGSRLELARIVIQQAR